MSETFLQDVVARWRQQSFGSVNMEPDFASQPEPAPRPGMATGALRHPAAGTSRTGMTASPMAPDVQASRLRRTLPPNDGPAVAHPQSTAEAGSSGAQQSLSNLLKQFRA